MDTLEVLVAARAEIEKGWGHAAVDAKGNVCALGAIDVALGGSRTEPHLSADAERWDVVDALWPLGDSVDIVKFNDAPGTTKADVLALFDRAIAAEAVKATSDPAHVYTLA